MMRSFSHKSGFTLVELAIVLVIIGLLVGGVLVGQDLIKQAEIRSVVDYTAKTNAAVNTFRSKYGGYPGDLIATRATQFGLLPAARNGGDGRGDGDGIVEAAGGAATGNVLGGENAMFWRDLSQSALITDNFSTATDAASVSLTSATVPAWIPATRLRDSTSVHILSSTGRNYYYVDGISATSAAGVITSSGSGLTVLEANAVDEKLDDGMPLLGTALAVNALAAAEPHYALETGAAPAAAVCVSNVVAAPNSTYNLGDAYLNTPSCGLLVRASF